MEIANKREFIEIKFTGYVNGGVFDSNMDEELKKIDAQKKPRETIIVVGEGMLVPGFDQAIEGKELGKEYEVKVSAKEGFGDRKRELMKTIPLKVFTEKKINPYPGMVLAMDENLARVVTISGARVLTDFNNPLAGKDLVYKFIVVRKVTDEKEKAKALLEFMFKFVPEFEVGESVVIKGPKFIEAYVTAFNPKFKELMGKELKLEEAKEKSNREDKKENKPEHSHEHADQEQ
jgi:FKBP-type peptidyl-prolyl cis-trans isomerase 2